MTPYYSYKNFLTEKFGQRVQKLAIDAGFTCPNRDGAISEGGCTFCSNDAFNPSYCVPTKSILYQLEEGIGFHQKRYRRASSYLAYFQAYSNTYADLEKLQEIYEQALEHPLVKGIIIGTRPDCLDDKKIDYLAELAKKTFVSVEIGVESIHNETLLKINRGHTFECAKETIEKLALRNIHSGAHFIFGLPNETPEMWLNDVEIINKLPINSIKFHQLQIFKGTKMEAEYLQNPEIFYPFTMDSYIKFIVDFAEKLRPDIAIDRFAGEVPPRFLSINNWGTIRYDVISQRILKEFERRKV